MLQDPFDYPNENLMDTETTMNRNDRSWRDLPLSLGELGARARSVLARLSITQLGAFLDADFQSMSIRQLGAGTLAQLTTEQERLRQLLSEAQESPTFEIEVGQFWEHQSSRSESPPDQFLPLPKDLVYVDDVVNLRQIWPFVVREVTSEREYEILTRRFNLDGQGQYTFDDIGSALKVSRERVRQIEVVALKKLTSFLDGERLKKTFRAPHPTFLEEVANLQHSVQAVRFPLPDFQLENILIARYGAVLSVEEKGFFTLLFKVWNWELCQLSPPEVLRPIKAIWLDTEHPRAYLITAVNALMASLRALIHPTPIFKLLVDVNHALKVKGYPGLDSAGIRQLSTLCSSIEFIDDCLQWRFSDLPSHVGRVERVMREWAVQGKTQATVAELRREVNHRLAREGRSADAGSTIISSSCATSKVLVEIGGTGVWSLIENAGDTRVWKDMIEEAMKVLNRPVGLEEIINYIAEKRNVKSSSIAGTLSQHHEFQRVSHGLWALRSWGLPNAAPVKRGAAFQSQFDTVLEEVFLEHDVQPIPRGKLTRILCERLG